MKIHTESAFEAAIEADLLDPTLGGHVEGDSEDFDRERALFHNAFISFVQASQADVWKKLAKHHGDNLKPAVLDALAKALDAQGPLSVLRHGFKFFGERIHAAFFKPAHGLNPETELRFQQNCVSIARQVRFIPDHNDSVDMVVAVNGIPVVTMELKNPLTGQGTTHAIRQYLKDRDPKYALLRFNRGALVHFAIDPDTVYMTTELKKDRTRFLPFNLGDHGGAGNPTPKSGGYKTAYLWREVLARDSLLDLLARFVHLDVKEDEVGGKKVEKRSIIFPRYHQLDVVRRLEDAARTEGAGRNYLIQHSAGSGKSNSIAWTAHRLATLHNASDEKVFHSVVVVTDRRVLDKQLQDTIYQFEHKQGVVARIDKDSAQLAENLENGTPIVITTLQKFPFVANKITKLPDRRYAIIVDEAHSSQTGTSAQKLKEVLTGDDAEEPEEPTWEDEIADAMGSRGPQKNLSFFAFTATPKAKTLEVFGTKAPNGKPVAFHLYSMRQAIEEGFIIDVLKNFTSYKLYYKLVQTSAQDPDVRKREAATALAGFVSLHPHNISQKVEVIVEHFRTHVRQKIGGRAKAMVVTRSRLHAVRYKRAIDGYIKDKGYKDLGALVAFSGTVTDPDSKKDYTEVGLNPGQTNEKELPELFKRPQWQVLIVANKYQTGFDEPLLHTMYVDRRLSGVQAVQTLSRLNRTYPGKEDTFVLDFVNDADEIKASFQPFYEQTTVSELADPGQLDQLQHDLDEGQIWQPSEIEAFSKVFYKPKDALTTKENEALYQWLQPSVDRFKAWKDEEKKEVWRAKLASFVRLYAFLSQVMPYADRELEMRFSFGRLLLRRLPRPTKEQYDFDGEVDLHSYRLARLGETNIVLEKTGTGEVKGPTAVGTGAPKDDKVALHELIGALNDRFGTEFKAEDQLFVEHIVASAKTDDTLQTKAKANTYENFALSAADAVQDKVIDGLDTHGNFVSKYLNDPNFKKVVLEYVAKRLWNEIRID
jgi:type I restriction enzyme R subunit